VGDCKGHAVDVPNWTQVTVVGSCDTARANVYQVAVAGVGGTATFKDGTDGAPIGGSHGVVAVASHYGNATTGNGGWRYRMAGWRAHTAGPLRMPKEARL
jgi:hypothetical protein